MNYLVNLPGWRSKRKIVVIESDDWGTVRMPSNDTLSELEHYGMKVSNDPFLSFDGLEKAADLTALFETLVLFRDQHGNHPVFTAFCVTANPDFDKIRLADYRKYNYEKVSDTMVRYDGNEAALDLWKEGKAKKIFVPEFHGREHLNVKVWLEALQKRNKDALFAFDYGVCGISGSDLAAFNPGEQEELIEQEAIIRSGVDLFREILEYDPVCFVPANGRFDCRLDSVLMDCGIRYVYREKLFKDQRKKILRNTIGYLGKKNEVGLRLMTRNCLFEPTVYRQNDNVNNCLKQISNMFLIGKPAIISSHRVNYVGRISISNRIKGLQLLKELLAQIVKRWPDVEFMTTSELGQSMEI